jgi:hypothetical protein
MSKRLRDKPDPHQSATATPLSFVRASDLGTWAYCNRAWWLARVQGVEPIDSSVLDSGTRFHVEHARAVARGRRMARVGAVLIFSALLIVALLLLQALAG